MDFSRGSPGMSLWNDTPARSGTKRVLDREIAESLAVLQVLREQPVAVRCQRRLDDQGIPQGQSTRTSAAHASEDHGYLDDDDGQLG